MVVRIFGYEQDGSISYILIQRGQRSTVSLVRHTAVAAIAHAGDGLETTRGVEVLVKDMVDGAAEPVVVLVDTHPCALLR